MYIKRKSALIICLAFLLSLTLSRAAFALIDSDNDLLPDEWELQYFGSKTAANPFDDSDNDRLTNLDERFAESNPTTFTLTSSLSERALLKLFQGKTFLYFWEQSQPPYYFTHDSANYDGGGGSGNFNSIAAIGFSFAAYVIADQNDWVKHADAYLRIKTALARLVELQGESFDTVCTNLNLQGNRHGYLYHFIDDNGTRAYPNVEISTIDQALLTAGALLAATYYPGTEAAELAQTLFTNTDWNWLYDSNFNLFYQGWIENCLTGGFYEGGDTLDYWNRYSELLILLFQTMSASPETGVGPAAWETLAWNSPVMFPFEWADIVPGTGPKNFAFLSNMPNVSEEPGYTNSATKFRYIHAGSLHNHQYSHMFVDFRERRDGFRQTDFFANSINASMANREFCIQLNAHAFGGIPQSPDPYLLQPYETYGPNSWGLLAGIVSDGSYKVMQPIIISWDDFSPNNIAANNDSGTVFLYAPLASTSFVPRQAIDFARNILSLYQAAFPGYDALIGRYGFRNAFNLGRGYYKPDPPGHFPTAAIGIDAGALIGGIENYLTGLVWKFAMRNQKIVSGMASGAGFNTGIVEPYIMNFDADSPPPQDPAWSGVGGDDPNSFGGVTMSFGSGSFQYIDIGDPFPNVPYGPEEFALKISALNNTDSGVFVTLNHHSASRWDRVSFWIKGASADEDFLVGLKDSPQDYLGKPVLQETEVKVSIKNYIPGGKIPAEWTEVRIPLEEFQKNGVRLTRLHNISFTNSKPGGGEILIDDIAFLGDEFKPKPPAKVMCKKTPAGVLIQWNESQETDVVGYNIYRNLPGEPNYTRLSETLVVGINFLDPAPPADSQYVVTALDNADPQNESAFSKPCRRLKSIGFYKCIGNC